MKQWHIWLEVRLVVVEKRAMFHLDLPDNKKSDPGSESLFAAGGGRSLAVVVWFCNSQLDAVNMDLSRGTAN
jgi:hypothetical protein